MLPSLVSRNILDVLKVVKTLFRSYFQPSRDIAPSYRNFDLKSGGVGLGRPRGKHGGVYPEINGCGR